MPIKSTEKNITLTTDEMTHFRTQGYLGPYSLM